MATDIDWEGWIGFLEGKVRPIADSYLRQAGLKVHVRCFVEDHPPALVLEPSTEAGMREVAIRLGQRFQLRWYEDDGVLRFKPQDYKMEPPGEGGRV